MVFLSETASALQVKQASAPPLKAAKGARHGCVAESASRLWELLPKTHESAGSRFGTRTKQEALEDIEMARVQELLGLQLTVD